MFRLIKKFNDKFLLGWGAFLVVLILAIGMSWQIYQEKNESKLSRQNDNPKIEAGKEQKKTALERLISNWKCEGFYICEVSFNEKVISLLIFGEENLEDIDLAHYPHLEEVYFGLDEEVIPGRKVFTGKTIKVKVPSDYESNYKNYSLVFNEKKQELVFEKIR